MQLARAFLWITSLTMAGFGVAFLLFPDELAGFVGIELRTDSARTDFMATYGGLELGVAAFLAYCATAAERLRLGLVAGAMALAGFGGARLLGILTAGSTDPIHYLFLGLELLGVLLCAWGARRVAEPGRSG